MRFCSTSSILSSSITTGKQKEQNGDEYAAAVLLLPKVTPGWWHLGVGFGGSASLVKPVGYRYLVRGAQNPPEYPAHCAPSPAGVPGTPTPVLVPCPWGRFLCLGYSALSPGTVPSPLHPGDGPGGTTSCPWGRSLLIDTLAKCPGGSPLPKTPGEGPLGALPGASCPVPGVLHAQKVPWSPCPPGYPVHRGRSLHPGQVPGDTSLGHDAK